MSLPVHVSVNLELTGIVLVAVAVWALRFTKKQIFEMRVSNRKQAESSRNQELQLRAGVLISLDERWEA
jgi:hypothetical protein